MFNGCNIFKLRKTPIDLSSIGVYFIEQGGYAEGQVPIYSAFTVTLYKSFSNTNYTIGLASESDDVSANTLSVGYGNSYYGTVKTNSKTTSSFGLKGYHITWYAHGY